MIELYDYQEGVLKKINRAFKKKSKALVVMASGLGKTIVAAFWTKSEIRKGKGLFLCHDTGILDQATDEFTKILGRTALLKTFYGYDKDWEADKAKIVFASFQTFAKGWREVFFEDEFDFVVVDESHHGEAPTYKKVIKYFKPNKLLGITATPDRMDERDIRKIFGKEIVNLSLEEGIANGYLSPVEYHVITDNLRQPALQKLVRDVLEKGKRITIKQLNETIFIKKRDEEIVQIIQSYSGNDKKTIVFCENVLHTENFQKFLPNSRVYHSKKSVEENRRTLSAFREGELQFILAVDKFNEGIDIPDAEVIVFLRCTDSRTVFFQQLGRGLRKILGKEKVIVLDFVANCERLAMVREMVEKVKGIRNEKLELSKELLQVTGETFNFLFKDEQMDVLEVIRRIKESFYATWPEASEAAIMLEMRGGVDYKKRYRVDPKLPSNPNQVYQDFPGWRKFLGREFYPTWQEASVAAIRVGAKNHLDYKRKYKIDPRLPSTPFYAYRNFPGWNIFLGRFYSTWQEASRAAIKLGAKTRRDYSSKRKLNPKLPSVPDSVYDDFPGWRVFLGKKKKEFYSTWQEASQVAIEGRISDSVEYKKCYAKIDSKLPANPNDFYDDFPGWRKFLGKDFYPTWQEAGKTAIQLGITNSREYKEKRIANSKLPGHPQEFYKDFPGWKKFLGKK